MTPFPSVVHFQHLFHVKICKHLIRTDVALVVRTGNGAGMTLCKDNTYCCWNTTFTSCDCSEGEETVLLPPVYVTSTVGITQSGTPYQALPTTFTSVLANGSKTTVTSLMTVPPATSTPDSESHEDHSGSNSQIGIDVGVPAASVAVILVLIWIVRRFKLRRAKAPQAYTIRERAMLPTEQHPDDATEPPRYETLQLHEGSFVRQRAEPTTS